jgi:hypothetical protein
LLYFSQVFFPQLLSISTLPMSLLDCLSPSTVRMKLVRAQLIALENRYKTVIKPAVAEVAPAGRGL